MRFYRNIDKPDRILTEEEARTEYREQYDGDDDTNPLRFMDQYKRVTGSDATLADIDYTIKTHEPADKYKYMLLDRLRTDCEYFLGHGNGYQLNLWGQSIETHIEVMRRLYNSFPEGSRPEWLTLERIEGYEKGMKEATK